MEINYCLTISDIMMMNDDGLTITIEWGKMLDSNLHKTLFFKFKYKYGIKMISVLGRFVWLSDFAISRDFEIIDFFSHYIFRNFHIKFCVR